MDTPDNQNRICPSCGSSLEPGLLAGGGFGIAFYPGEQEYNLLASVRMLFKFARGNRLFRLIGTKAFNCKNCRCVSFTY